MQREYQSPKNDEPAENEDLKKKTGPCRTVEPRAVAVTTLRSLHKIMNALPAKEKTNIKTLKD